MQISRNKLLKEIKQNVLALEPKAEIILYGSRARGDFAPDSDWDLLVLTSKSNNSQLKKSIFNSFYNLDLEYNVVLSFMLKNQKEWNDLQLSPFYNNVMKEGITLT